MNLQDAEQIINAIQQVRALRADLNVVISYLNQNKELDSYAKFLETQNKTGTPLQEGPVPGSDESVEENLEGEEGPEEDFADEENPPVDIHSVSESTVEEGPRGMVSPKPHLVEALPRLPLPPPQQPSPPVFQRPMSMAKQLELKMMKTRAKPVQKEYQI